MGMTNEEAIKELRDASDSEVRYGDTDHHYNEVMKRIEAFDLAIKALEQQPILDKIRAEIEEEPYISKMEVLDIIDKYMAESEETE